VDFGQKEVSKLAQTVGAKLQSVSTWKSIMDKMLSKLQNWKYRYLSLGARVTLLNSVLNSIPIYYLSIDKIPKAVLKRMISIQRSFLWGGANLDKNNHMGLLGPNMYAKRNRGSGCS
jgi:hypothetical protein